MFQVTYRIIKLLCYFPPDILIDDILFSLSGSCAAYFRLFWFNSRNEGAEWPDMCGHVRVIFTILFHKNDMTGLGYIAGATGRVRSFGTLVSQKRWQTWQHCTRSFLERVEIWMRCNIICITSRDNLVKQLESKMITVAQTQANVKRLSDRKYQNKIHYSKVIGSGWSRVIPVVWKLRFWIFKAWYFLFE